jgi:Flp pilus assembly protein TadG
VVQHLILKGRRLVGDFRRDTSGVLAILVVLMIPVMAGMMGLSVDVGLWYAAKRGLQNAADAGALAGGTELANGGDSSAITSTVTADAVRNGYDSTTDTLTINNPPLAGANAGNDGSVEVEIVRALPLFFSSVFLDRDMTARVRAVVNTEFVDEFCILGLDPTAAKAVNVFGTGAATLDCGIAVNSSADNALNVGGSASISVTTVTTVGGVDVSSNGTLDTDAAPRRGGAVDDPYDDLAIPTFDPDDCEDDSTGRDGGNNAYTAVDGETLEANSGVFVICGGLSVSSGDTLFMDPGTYIIDQGDFKINGGASVIGEGVTIILTSSGNDNKIGSISVNGGADIELSAPTSDYADADGYSGVLFYQDRDVSSSPSNSNSFNGGAELDLQGALYVPGNDLDFTGGATAGDGCMQLIGQTVNIGGDAGVQGNCGSAGTRSVGRLTAKLGE